VQLKLVSSLSTAHKKFTALLSP